MKYPLFKITIECMTFNQSKYIGKTLDGFCIQQTEFPFVCCIIDDASTDGEQIVINTYLETHFDFSESSVSYTKETDYAKIIYAQHKVNKQCFFMVLFLKENHYSQKKSKTEYLKKFNEGIPYEAICEGDDYWIDPEKLSKQVSFLETHKEYGFTYARAYTCNEKDEISNKYIFGSNAETFNDIIARNTIPTLTTVYRKALYSNYLKEIKRSDQWGMGDYPMWLYFILHSKVHFINDIVGVYRVLPESASHSRSLKKKIKFVIGEYRVRLDMLKYANRKDLVFLAQKELIKGLVISIAYKIAILCRLK